MTDLLHPFNSKITVSLDSYMRSTTFGTAFSANAIDTNKFCLNVSSTSTAIYSQSIVNTNNFFTDFY